MTVKQIKRIKCSELGELCSSDGSMESDRRGNRGPWTLTD